MNFIKMLIILNGYLICGLFPIFGVFMCVFIPVAIFEDISEDKNIKEYKLFQLAFLHALLSVMQWFLIFAGFNILTIIYIIIFQITNIVIAVIHSEKERTNF